MVDIYIYLYIHIHIPTVKLPEIYIKHRYRTSLSGQASIRAMLQSHVHLPFLETVKLHNFGTKCYLDKLNFTRINDIHEVYVCIQYYTM